MRLLKYQEIFEIRLNGGVNAGRSHTPHFIGRFELSPRESFLRWVTDVLRWDAPAEIQREFPGIALSGD
jgi:hypothetical protein